MLPPATTMIKLPTGNEGKHADLARSQMNALGILKKSTRRTSHFDLKVCQSFWIGFVELNGLSWSLKRCRVCEGFGRG